MFPAFSASWKISSEEFFEPLKNVVNLLKVRGSWGQVGNVALVPRYSWNVPLNETDWAMIYGKDLNNIVYGGVYAGSIGTKDLKWETTEQWGVGLDMGLLDNSLNLTVDYFNKRTKDLIEVVPVPSVAGISVSPYGNVGDVVNRGWEFGLSYSKKIGHVTFGVNGNLSTVHNEVLDLGNLEFMQHNVVINSLTQIAFRRGPSLVFLLRAEDRRYLPESGRDRQLYLERPRNGHQAKSAAQCQAR